MMNPTIKAILIPVTKNAVNAILTNATLMAAMSGVFNMHSHDGWWNILKLTVSVVCSREVMVYGPKLLKWSESNGTGN